MARLRIPDEATAVEYSVASETAIFPFTFAVFAKADLTVIHDDVALAQSAFTLSGAVTDTGGYQGGAVVLVTPVTSGTLRIERNVRPERATQFGAVSSVPVASVDMAFNRVTAVTQDLKRRLDAGGGGSGGGGVAGVSSVNGRTGSVDLTKSDVGLSNVDNTSDAAKPVSTAQATALAGKANISHTHTIANVTGLQTALDAKVSNTALGAVGGVATLGLDGKLTSTQAPTSGSYKGVWNANTNSPTITSGTGVNGDFYKVGTAGTTTIDTIASWAIGDEIRFNGTVWQKIAATAAVSSVNGDTGAVTITASDLGVPTVDGVGVVPATFKKAMLMSSARIRTPEQYKTGGNTWAEAIQAMYDDGEDGAVFELADFTYDVDEPLVFDQWDNVTWRGGAASVINYTGTAAALGPNGAIVTIGGESVSLRGQFWSDLRVTSATALNPDQWAFIIRKTVDSEYHRLRPDNGNLADGGLRNGIWFDRYDYVTLVDCGEISLPLNGVSEAIRLNGGNGFLSAGIDLGGVKGTAHIGLRFGGGTGGSYPIGTCDFINCNLPCLIDDRLARDGSNNTIPNREIMFGPNWSFDGGQTAGILVDQNSANFYLNLAGVWSASSSGGSYIDIDRTVLGTYLGPWNASTNTPTITSSVGATNQHYVVTTAGSTNINGVSSWSVGDIIQFVGGVWTKVTGKTTITASTGHGVWIYKGPNTYVMGEVYAYANVGDGFRNQDKDCVGQPMITSRLNGGYGFNDLGNNGAGLSSGLNPIVQGTATLGLMNASNLPTAVRNHMTRLSVRNILASVGYDIGTEASRNFYLRLVDGDTNPVISFDPNDFLKYERSTNDLTISIGAAIKSAIDASRARFNVPVYSAANESAVIPDAKHFSFFYVNDTTVRLVMRGADGTARKVDLALTPL